MAHFTATIESPWSPDAAFAYMADVRNFADWDPGTGRAVLVQGGGPGLGSVYDLEATAGPGTTTLRYEVVEWEPPRRFLMRAETRLLRSVDEIRVVATASGSAITYDVTLTLRGIAGFASPLLGPMLKRIGNRGAEGLRTAVASDAATAP
jgi:hypothetical protein